MEIDNNPEPAAATMPELEPMDVIEKSDLNSRITPKQHQMDVNIPEKRWTRFVTNFNDEVRVTVHF